MCKELTIGLPATKGQIRQYLRGQTLTIRAWVWRSPWKRGCWSLSGQLALSSLLDLLAGEEETEALGEETDDVEEETQIEEIDFDDLSNDDDEDH